MHTANRPVEAEVEGVRGNENVTTPEPANRFSTRARNFIDWILKHAARETTSIHFIPEIDGLRFIAIGMVILFHLNGYLLAKSTLPMYSVASSSDWLAQVAIVGFRGVELFFVISGFILALPFATHHLQGKGPVNLPRYYLRRLTRLEPPYFLAVILLFLLAWKAQGHSATALLPHLAASLLYLHSLIYGAFSPVIGVGWSLEIEVQFYLLVPLLTCVFMIRSKLKRRAIMVAAILFLLSFQEFVPPSNHRMALSILAYLQFFLAGFLLADIYISDWKQAPAKNFAWDLVSLCAWPALIWMLHSHTLTHWMFPFVVALLYCGAFRGKVSSRTLSNRLITTVGGMCYSIYLIHYEVISAIGRFTRTIAEGSPYYIYLLTQSALTAVAIVFICGIYFLAIEKPCMDRDWPKNLVIFVKGKMLAKPIAEAEG